QLRQGLEDRRLSSHHPWVDHGQNVTIADESDGGSYAPAIVVDVPVDQNGHIRHGMDDTGCAYSEATPSTGPRLGSGACKAVSALRDMVTQSSKHPPSVANTAPMMARRSPVFGM